MNTTNYIEVTFFDATLAEAKNADPTLFSIGEEEDHIDDWVFVPKNDEKGRIDLRQLSVEHLLFFQM